MTDIFRCGQWVFVSKKSLLSGVIRFFSVRFPVQVIAEIPVLEAIYMKMPQGGIERGIGHEGLSAFRFAGGLSQVFKDLVLAGAVGHGVFEYIQYVAGRGHITVSQENAGQPDAAQGIEGQAADLPGRRRILFQHEPEGHKNMGVDHIPVVVDAMALEPLEDFVIFPVAGPQVPDFLF